MKAKKVSRQEFLKILEEANKAHAVKEFIFSDIFDVKNDDYEKDIKLAKLNANTYLFDKNEFVFLKKYIEAERSFLVANEETLVHNIISNLNKEMLKNAVVDKLVNDFNLKNEFELDELMMREKLAKLFLLKKNKHLIQDDVYEELKEEIEDNYYSEFGKLKNPILI